MPFSEFVKSFKAASMLEARQTLTNINVASFTSYDESDRKKYIRDLQSISSQFMERKLKDYREVLGNIARKLMRNG